MEDDYILWMCVFKYKLTDRSAAATTYSLQFVSQIYMNHSQLIGRRCKL